MLLVYVFDCCVGLTGTVILRSGKLSDVILQLQELTKGVNESVSSPGYDGAYYAAQVYCSELILFLLNKVPVLL